jgi:hypothetical protein
MVIAATDIKLFYSGTSSKNGPGGPQGGVISTNFVTEQTIAGGITIGQTVFKDVEDTQSRNGDVRYFCGYWKNTHATQTATNLKMWQSSITPGNDNIRLGYSGVAANGHDTLNTEASTKLYDVPASSSLSRMDHDRFRAGIYVASKSAKIYDKPITLAEFYFQRFGTPTGTMFIRQKNRKSETVKVEFGSIDVTTINNSTPTLYSFAQPANTVKLAHEDVIGAEYTTGTETNYIAMIRKAGSPVSYVHSINHDGTQWRDIPDFDMSAKLYTAGTAGDTTAPTGLNFENPVSRETAIALPDLAPGAHVPFWLRREVPANCAKQDNNSSELTLEFRSPTP